MCLVLILLARHILKYKTTHLFQWKLVQDLI
nr:MAG TPA: hypothetical protein [Caudoviricetes sp.]